MFRKTRELFEARLENERLKLNVEQLQRELTRAEKQVAGLEGAYELASKRAIKAERDAAIYRERLDIVANHLPQTAGPTVKHMSEEVEDLEYAFRSGLIDKGELEAELQAAGFQSAEIELDLTPPRI